jgi:hypothetical protein
MSFPAHNPIMSHIGPSSIVLCLIMKNSGAIMSHGYRI